MNCEGHMKIKLGYFYVEKKPSNRGKSQNNLDTKEEKQERGL